MEQLKTGISEIDNKLGNPSDDKFLFVFTPEVEEDCLCGLSQKMTVRIISIIRQKVVNICPKLEAKL